MSTKTFPSTGAKPAFNPNASFEAVQDTPAPTERKPAFNPNAHFEPVHEVTQQEPKPVSIGLQQPNNYQIQISQPSTSQVPTQPQGERTFNYQQSEHGTPIENKSTYELKFQLNALKAHDIIQNELKGNKDIKADMIKQRRFEQAALKVPISKTDMPKTQAEADVQRLIPQAPKPQELPVTEGDLAKEDADVMADRGKAVRLLEETMKKYPEKAKELQKNIYTVDAANSLAPGQENRLPKIEENAKRIDKGQLIYDARSRKLLRPMGLLDSAIEGWKEDSKNVADYEFLQKANNDDILNEYHNRQKEVDIDNPIPVPKGKLSEIAQMIGGMPLKPLAAGAIGSLGGPEAGGAAATLVGGRENQKREYAGTFWQTLDELIKKGTPENEAVNKARELAGKAGQIGALTGAAMGLTGARMADLPFAKPVLSNSFKQAAFNVLKQSGSTLGKAGLEGLTIGGIGAAGQYYKNKLAQEAGIFRPLDQGLADQLEGGLMMTVAMAAAIKAGKGISKGNYRNLLHGLSKMPDEQIGSMLQNKVQNGEITQKAADETQQRINDYKAKDAQIPPNVTEEARFKIQDNIDKLNELEKQKEATHKSLQDPIKEKIQKLTDENLALSKETEKPIKPESGLTKDQEKEATEIAEEWLHEGIIPDSYEGAIKKDPIGFWKFLSQQAHNTDDNWRPNEGPSPEQGMREDLGDTVVDYAKELFPAPKKETPQSVSVIQPGEIKHPETITNTDNISVGELLDKEVSYKGQKGMLYQDGQTVVFKVKGANREYEIGNVDEVKNHPINDYGIEHETSVVGIDKEGNISVRGNSYKNNYSDPLMAINRDKDGNIVSVNLETKDGQKRTFRGNIAEDIAYNISLKEINKNNATKSAFEEFINSDESTKKQIEDAGLSETTQKGTNESDSQIQRVKIKPESLTSEIKPVSEQIAPNKEFQTMGMGNDEGKQETKEARTLMKQRMLQGDVPIDGEGGKGETGRGFAGRVISAWENLKKSGDNNTTLVTHSSVLKAIKAWENPETWKGVEKPIDPANMNNDQWLKFADEYNKESTENGDLETFKGDNGDIHVIRHGQTEDNKMNKFRSGNTNLTDEGIQQAHDVGKRLQEKTGGNVPQIVSSDLPRAIHTSNIIHENLKPTENAIQEKSSLNLQEKPYGKLNTNKDFFPERSQTEPRINRETAENIIGEVQAARLQTSLNWLEAIERNDTEKSANEAQELIRQSLDAERQIGNVLDDNDRGRTQIRASSDYGKEVGTQTEQMGARPSQEFEQPRQQPGQFGTSESIRSQQNTSQITNAGTEKGIRILSEAERKSVVEEVRKLSELRNNREKASSIRALRDMLEQSIRKNPSQTKEIIDLITENLPNYALRERISKKISVDVPSGSSQEVGPRVSESGETTNAQGQQGASQEGEGTSKEKVGASVGGENLIGISHDALNELAQRLGLPKIERGQVRTPEEYAQMGRELLKQGIDPNTVLNSHLEPHEKAGVARAYLEEMVKNADAIEDKNSAQYKQALQDIADFKANVVKKLGTQFAELGRALQGKRDLETDSFTAVSSKITDDTGKPLTQEQAQKVKELTEKNKALQSKVDDLEAKLTKATEDDLGKEPSKGTKNKKSHEQYVKERKNAFDAARKALKDLRSGKSGLGVSIPLVRELGAITPHTFKIVKSLLEEGVNKLGDIVDAIHDEFSKDIIGLRRRDVIDLISGKYAATKDIKPNELTEIRKQSKLVAKLEDLQNGLPEDFDKNKKEQSPEVKKLIEQIKKVKKDLADMGYMKSKKDEPFSAEEKNIKRLEKELENLKQGIAKQKSPTRELTAKENELKEQIKDERQKLGLISSKMEKPLTEQELQEQHEDNIKNLQEQFINKKGNKFTYDEAKSIWGYMKENYLDKGVKFRDAIEQVSNDIGLSFEQISNAITTPKTKRISDAMWKQRYDLQKNRMATQRYVDAQNQNPAIRLFKKITGARRGESIFGHAGVFVGTHAGMTLFDLPRTKYTIKAFLNAYKFGYGKIANYEKSMEGLKKRPNYELAQRSGLKNNPDIIDNDAEITKPFLSKYLGKFMESGKRGYNAMKILRQDLFDAHYNALSDVEKADPGSAISIAKEINNATGATNLDLAIRNKQGNIVFDPNEVFFAPGMEAARWAKLTRNPAKATSVALQALFKPSSVSIKDKVFAKVWAKRVGTQLATFSALLTANAAMQSMFTDDKNKKVNLFDPTKSDWLKFKFGNTTFENTSGMLSTLHFIEQMAYQSAFDESSKYHTNEESSTGKTILKYGVGKLAPFYGDVAEVILRHDYNGNTMPWSDAKPLHGYNHKLTWEEYAESKLPLPVAEGFKAFYESAQENGMSKSQIGDILNGLQYGFISGTTGFKAYETKSSNEGSGGGAGASGTYEKPTRTKPHKIHR